MVRVLPHCGLRGLWFDFLGVLVELKFTAVEWLIPRLGLAAWLRRLVRTSVPPLGSVKATREQGGPWLGTLWSLRYRRRLWCTSVPTALSQPGAPPTAWLEPRPAVAGRRSSPPGLARLAADDKPRVVLVFIHGGGFACYTPTEYAFAGEILPRLHAKGLNPALLSLDYTLAGAAGPGSGTRALQCAQLLYSWRALAAQLRAKGLQDTPVVLAGDSAGGHHALALTLALAKEARVAGPGTPAVLLPTALVLISPWLDVLQRGAVYRTQCEGDYLKLEFLQELQDVCRAAGHTGSELWPPHEALTADLTPYFPPTHLTIGGGEFFRDECTELGQVLVAQLGAERACVLEVPSAPHDCVLLPAYDHVPGDASRAMDHIAAFIHTHASAPTAVQTVAP